MEDLFLGDGGGAAAAAAAAAAADELDADDPAAAAAAAVPTTDADATTLEQLRGYRAHVEVDNELLQLAVCAIKVGRDDVACYALHRAPLAGRSDFVRCWRMLANLARRGRVYD